MKLIFGILTFFLLAYVTFYQGFISSSRLKNLAGDKKIDLKSKKAKKSLKKLDVVKGKINKELNRYKTLEKDLEKTRNQLQEDKTLGIEEVEKLRSKIIELKKQLGLNVELEDSMRAFELAYSDYKGMSLEDIFKLTEDEKDQLFDPIGGRVWLNKYYLNTIMQSKPTPAATQAEIKLNIQRRKLLSLRNKIKRSKMVIDNKLDDIKSKKTKRVNFDTNTINEQKKMNSEEREFDE